MQVRPHTSPRSLPTGFPPRLSGPTTVLVMSLVFIAFVVLLHIWGKFRSA